MSWAVLNDSPPCPQQTSGDCAGVPGPVLRPAGADGLAQRPPCRVCRVLSALAELTAVTNGREKWGTQRFNPLTS